MIVNLHETSLAALVLTGSLLPLIVTSLDVCEDNFPNSARIQHIYSGTQNFTLYKLGQSGKVAEICGNLFSNLFGPHFLGEK